jgi:hypothetical protein
MEHRKQGVDADPLLVPRDLHGGGPVAGLADIERLVEGLDLGDSVEPPHLEDRVFSADTVDARLLPEYLRDSADVAGVDHLSGIELIDGFVQLQHGQITVGETHCQGVFVVCPAHRCRKGTDTDVLADFVLAGLSLRQEVDHGARIAADRQPRSVPAKAHLEDVVGGNWSIVGAPP